MNILNILAQNLPLQQQQNLDQQHIDSITENNNNLNSENGTENNNHKLNYKNDIMDNHSKNPPPPAPYGLSSSTGCKIAPPLQIAVQDENQQSVVKSDLSPVSEEDLVLNLTY